MLFQRITCSAIFGCPQHTLFFVRWCSAISDALVLHAPLLLLVHSPLPCELQVHAPYKGSHATFAGCIPPNSCMSLCTSVSAACTSGDVIPLIRCASHCVRCAPACAHAAPGMRLDPLMAGGAAASAACGTLHLTCASGPSPAARHHRSKPLLNLRDTTLLRAGRAGLSAAYGD